MNNIKKRLDQVVGKELEKNLIPIKTDQGILVGVVLIVSDSNLKHIWRADQKLYENIFLNISAITIANLMNRYSTSLTADNIYRSDQEYGRHFVDSQMLRNQHQKSLNNKDYDRADILWARYCESRDRALTAKNHVQGLAKL